MKKVLRNFIYLLGITFSANAQNTFPSSGSAGIGTTTPNASSLLEMVSTSKGLLISRMTKNQRDAIGSPATGLLIYQTNNNPGFYYYDGSSWNAVTPKSKDWSLTGNAGTNPSTNFLGTTDAQPLVFRVNNQRAGYIDYLNAPLPSAGNTAFGYQTLISNTGWANTAMGYNALQANTSGYYNTATGNSALLKNTTGSFNTAHGYDALSQNTTGSNNTAFGEGSLGSNSTGSNNTATGERALLLSTTGNDNTATGNYALFFNTTGSYNTGIGSFSFRYNTTGSYNTGIGYTALYANSEGNYNSATGYQSLYSNLTGLYNSANGAFSLYSNTSGAYNTAHGVSALYSNTTASNNTATGEGSLYYNTVSGDNTANGYLSLYTNGTGASQSFDATANTAIGSYSLYSNTIGYNNTASGKSALYFTTSGYNNAAYGLQALYSNMTGIGNTAIGVASDVNQGNLQNATAVGYYALSTASNQVRIGNNSVTSIGGYANWTNISDGRVKKNIKANVPGLAFINKLKPVTYNLDLEAADKISMKQPLMDKNGNSLQISSEQMAARKSKETVLYTGFVAQDVEKAAKSLNYDFSGIDAAKNDKDLYGLRYAEFVVPLVKAVQELSAKNDDLQKQIDDLKMMMTTGKTTSVQIDNASLEQNIPNPSINSTMISYTLPSKFTKAQIVITDRQGKTLRTMQVSGSGKNTLQLQLNLAAGTYNYSLVVNDKIISTKQMMIGK